MSKSKNKSFFDDDTEELKEIWQKIFKNFAIWIAGSTFTWTVATLIPPTTKSFSGIVSIIFMILSMAVCWGSFWQFIDGLNEHPKNMKIFWILIQVSSLPLALYVFFDVTLTPLYFYFFMCGAQIFFVAGTMPLRKLYKNIIDE